MSETKFTPGPWDRGEERHAYDIAIRNADRDPVALCLIAGYGKQTGKANAALIAAAPDLYAALRDLCDTLDPDCDGSGCEGGQKHSFECAKTIYSEARAALARARGEGKS